MVSPYQSSFVDEDVDECSDLASNNCHAMANCTDTEGSFTCSCNTGYSGNGVSCNSEYEQTFMNSNIVNFHFGYKLTSFKTLNSMPTTHYGGMNVSAMLQFGLPPLSMYAMR